MGRKILETLTESMFYVLMALLRQARCGTEIADFVAARTKSRVRLGPGTLYTILAKFEEVGLIRETAVEGRKRTYVLTDEGRARYEEELVRLRSCLADAEEEKLALRAENEQQRQAIAEFQPLRQYIDTILSSTGAIATTQIAADYDISAKQLNKILHEEGLQHCVNGQWILYRRHMGKGYTKSETIPITRSDGRTDTRIYTKWTQKGRILIHEILTRRGILAVMDRQTAG